MDHVTLNVRHWEGRREREVRLARRRWAAEEPTWGNFGVPEAVARILPADLHGARTVELGCGTGYVSAWLARRGALPVAVDPTPGQLQIARQFQDEYELWFPLVRATGEQVPLRDGSFDLVISEYGAAIWADPYRWIPEAARLLRPGGELVFLGNSTLLVLCLPDEDAPASDRLLRPQFGIHRMEWADDSTVTFHLSHGDWIRLLRGNGFEIEDLVELRPQSDTADDSSYITTAWARRWPCEEAWRARKRDSPRSSIP
ncbi:MAG TPA: class I SAM-dependent methyltransferase [Acidimicrobiales bacterium]|nr:class I SAM-dependent methyltransferase [Acidimicrobiales bacterium]